MSLPEVPPPLDGELPVAVSEAARETGYSRHVINKRIERGILPAVLPMGYRRCPWATGAGGWSS